MSESIDVIFRKKYSKRPELRTQKIPEGWGFIFSENRLRR